MQCNGVNCKSLYKSNIWSSTNVFSAQDGDSDSEEAHPQQQNRTRQKKFVKNFKQLPSEEVVLQREWKPTQNLPPQKNWKRIMENCSRVLLRSDVWHPAARPSLCHGKLHCISLQCLWLCHPGKNIITMLFCLNYIFKSMLWQLFFSPIVVTAVQLPFQ